MLPSIVNVAQEYGLRYDPKTLTKKEVRFQCPFCNSRSGKYHLSLNKESDLFKCWKCGESGGVLKFEALLTNKSHEEVRRKYFGKRERKVHPAYKLTPQQLQKIGWENMKQEDFQNFIESKDKVYSDWKRYVYKEQVKYYALLTLIAHYPIREYQQHLFAWLSEMAQQSEVPKMWDRLMSEWNSERKQKWALEGIELARAIYKTSLATEDNFINIFSNVLIAMEMKRIKELQNRENSVSV